MNDSDHLAKYRADVRRTFQVMSDQALAFQNTRIPSAPCVDREEIDREYARRRAAGGTRITRETAADA